MYYEYMGEDEKIKRCTVSWFDEFECLCGSCPESCCRGWVIPLSESDVERFAAQKGLLGISLFIATGGRLYEKFNANSGSCPFWRRDGLCSLQKKHGHDFIPWTCQSYPRFYRNYGNFEEVCLDLSCIGAAKLFIKHAGRADTISSLEKPVTRQCTTNDDEAYLEFLLSQRKVLMDKSVTGFSGRFCGLLYEYAKFLQDRFTEGSPENYEGLSFDVFCKGYKDERTDVFPLSPTIFSGFCGTSLFHQKLRKVSPKLYKMLKGAQKALKRYENNPKEWSDVINRAFSSDPVITNVLGAYLSYYLFQYFLRTYETYSFRKQIALGLCHVNMIFLLSVTAFSGQTLTEDDMAKVIAVYNRRAYFNDLITDEMYRVFEDGLRRGV